MKKRIIKLAIAGAIAIIGTVGYNFSVNQNDANFQFTMDNVEALARGEGTSGSGRAICFSECIKSEDSQYLPCVTCEMVDGVGKTKGGYCRW